MKNHSHLQTDNIQLRFGSNKVLHGLSLTVEQGDIVGLIGPNGAGKTSLLNIMSGILKPQSGNIYLNGEDLWAIEAKARARKVAMVPQDPAIPEGFTVLEVVLMGRHPHLGFLQWEGITDLEVCHRVMGLTDTWAYSRRLVSSLSGGERQRVFIARALAQQAHLLLLDEPTANLDIQHQLQVMELMGSLTRQGLTVITAMHDLSLAARFCDRIVILFDGKILASGSPETVLTPSNLRQAFAIQAVVYRDSRTNYLTVGALGAAKEE